MNKEELIILKNKFQNLSAYEQIQRDLYLKRFYDGEILGPLTGNIYLDEPWVKNYLASPVENVILEETLYKNFRKIAEKYPDEFVVFDLLGNKMTYSELLEKVDKMACAFEKMGLKDLDKVAVLSTNTIDEPVSLLALNKIGVMAKFVDFSKDINDVKKSIKETNIRYIIMDEVLLPMSDFINENNIPIIVSGTEKHINEDGKISYPVLEQLGETKESNTVDFDSNRPSIMITSSGTTGKPKPIVHSDLSINSAALKVLYTNYDLGNGNVMLKIIPAHIGLGIITTLYTNIISNNKTVIISGKSPADFIDNMVMFIKEYKKFINLNGIDENSKLNIFGAPMFYKGLAANIESIDDLSFIGTMLAAGAKMTEEELEMLHSLYKSKGCDSYIYNGYGQNEMGGAVTLNSHSANHNGSAGFPVIGTDIRIIDIDNNDILGPNREGRIVERTSSSFIEYENMTEETLNSFITLPDGSVWFDTKDIGFINEEGFLFVTGRLSRVMVRFNCKISVEMVEDKFKSLDAVKDCAISTIKNNDNDENDIPIAFVSLKNPEQNINVIEELSRTTRSLSEFEMPEHIIYVEELPYMSNGKVNYTELKEKAIEYYKSIKLKKLS